MSNDLYQDITRIINHCQNEIYQLLYPLTKSDDWIPMRLPLQFQAMWLSLSQNQTLKNYGNIYLKSGENFISNNDKYKIATFFFEAHKSIWYTFKPSKKKIIQSEQTMNLINNENFSENTQHTPPEIVITESSLQIIHVVPNKRNRCTDKMENKQIKKLKQSYTKTTDTNTTNTGPNPTNTNINISNTNISSITNTNTTNNKKRRSNYDSKSSTSTDNIDISYAHHISDPIQISNISLPTINDPHDLPNHARGGDGGRRRCGR